MFYDFTEWIITLHIKTLPFLFALTECIDCVILLTALWHETSCWCGLSDSLCLTDEYYVNA